VNLHVPARTEQQLRETIARELEAESLATEAIERGTRRCSAAGVLRHAAQIVREGQE